MEDQKLHSYFQAKRLIQIFWAIELTLVLIAIQRLYLASYFHFFLIILIVFILTGVYRLAQQKKY